MRLLKFFAFFLITTILVFGLVFGLNWKSFTLFWGNRSAMAEGSEWVEKTYSLRGLTEYIAQHPEHVSIASVVVDAPDSSLIFQPDTPRVMGTTANFFILLAYALEIDRGTFSGDQRVEWTDVERYQLPELDLAVHTQAFNAAKNRNWTDGTSLSLEHALRLLAEYNDLALADHLWWKLNPKLWDEIPQILDLTSSEMPLPFSGLYLAISPGIQESSAEKILETWQAENHEQWREHVTGLSETWIHDPEQRENIRHFMERHRLGNSFAEERDAMLLFPKTTAGEMARLLQDLWENSLVNPGVSARIKSWMTWPMERQPAIQRDFTTYGAMHDNRMGLLNGIDFGTSAYTGRTTVQAIFFDRLPIGFWFHMSGNHMHQDFQQRLIYDPALIEQMERAIQHPNPPLY